MTEALKLTIDRRDALAVIQTEGYINNQGGEEIARAAYERGALLKRHCEAKLREAQATVEKIVIGPDGKPGTAPFAES